MKFISNIDDSSAVPKLLEDRRPISNNGMSIDRIEAVGDNNDLLHLWFLDTVQSGSLWSMPKEASTTQSQLIPHEQESCIAIRLMQDAPIAPRSCSVISFTATLKRAVVELPELPAPWEDW